MLPGSDGEGERGVLIGITVARVGDALALFLYVNI